MTAPPDAATAVANAHAWFEVNSGWAPPDEGTMAEWLAASNGLGYLVLSGSFNFNTARSFASIIALSCSS